MADFYKDNYKEGMTVYLLYTGYLIFWINRCHYDGGFLLSFIILHFFMQIKRKE